MLCGTESTGMQPLQGCSVGRGGPLQHPALRLVCLTSVPFCSGLRACSGPVQQPLPPPESYATHSSASLLGRLLLPDALPDHPTRLSAPSLRPASPYPPLCFPPSTHYRLTYPVVHLFRCSVSTASCPLTHQRANGAGQDWWLFCTLRSPSEDSLSE